ncbi:MAG: hypothetical protein ACSHW7_01840 [Patiriisocius sp.]|uniref:hypothetical protein n=1 Tax=Patiriisocius sp. TaxID=2822396 RepID=UPI003EF696C0
MDDYIKLYLNTKSSEKAKAIEIIKGILIEYKSYNYSWNLVTDKITSKFSEFKSEILSNSSKFNNLNKVFDDAKRKYEPGFSLNAIKFELKDAFDLIPNSNITFKEYVVSLATNSAFSRIERLFSQGNDLYRNMYRTNKFDGYKNLPKFDIRKFELSGNDYHLSIEIEDLAWPEEKAKRELAQLKQIEFDKISLKKNTLFRFQESYISALYSNEIFDKISNRYFNEETLIKDYRNVFFEEIEFHKSQIYLSCNTNSFATFLNELKNHLAINVNYSAIARSKCFITSKTKIPLKRINISTSIKNGSVTDLKIAKDLVDDIKNFPII